MQNETWKPCPGYEDIYEVSSFGAVRRICATRGSRKGYVLKGMTDGHGYRTYTLRKNGLFRSEKAHRLVCEAFLGKPDANRPFVNHKDGIRKNNHFENLEWVTHRENIQHAFAATHKGVNYRKGAEHPRAQRVLRTSADGATTVFETIKAAVAATPKATREGVWSAAKGIFKRHAGFAWQYV